MEICKGLGEAKYHEAAYAAGEMLNRCVKSANSQLLSVVDYQHSSPRINARGPVVVRSYKG